jgi:DNA repair exonuclease SbcCD ATPase subunit
MLLTVSSAICAWLPGCASTRIELAEKFGYAKREQLSDKVKSARDGQEEAKQQFESALAEFIAVTGVDVKDLESRYSRLTKEYERSKDRAAAVTDRIQSVERVGEALFREWNEELKQYTSETMRSASRRQLDQTRAQYDRLVGAMKAAESKMAPVLAAFNDQVLFLKHNLNARAVAALQGTVTQVQDDVAALVREMETAITEANSFIDQLSGS